MAFEQIDLQHRERKSSSVSFHVRLCGSCVPLLHNLLSRIDRSYAGSKVVLVARNSGFSVLPLFLLKNSRPCCLIVVRLE